jgi:hypothetical protein
MTDLTAPRLAVQAVLGEEEKLLLNAALHLLAEGVRAAGAACDLQVTVLDAARSDFLNPAAPALPAELQAQGLVPRSFRAYHGPLFQSGPRLVVLSLLADVVQPALRHREEGYLFLPLPAWERRWTAVQRQWVADHFLPEPLLRVDAAATHWQAICETILQETATGVFLCNVFRHIPEKAHRYFGTGESLRERVQRFNLMAAEISHDTGAFVVDLDRALADLGGRPLGSDYRLGGKAAAVAGAETLVATMLRAGLDDFVPPDVQEKAAAHFESRRQAPGWLSLQEYKTWIVRMLARFREGATEAGTLNAVVAQELGEFLQAHAAALDSAAAPAGLALHRRLVTALHDAGQGYLDYGQALDTGDSLARQRAQERIQTATRHFDEGWMVFDAYYQRHARPTG